MGCTFNFLTVYKSNCKLIPFSTSYFARARTFLAELRSLTTIISSLFRRERVLYMRVKQQKWNPSRLVWQDTQTPCALVRSARWHALLRPHVENIILYMGFHILLRKIESTRLTIRSRRIALNMSTISTGTAHDDDVALYLHAKHSHWTTTHAHSLNEREDESESEDTKNFRFPLFRDSRYN